MAGNDLRRSHGAGGSVAAHADQLAEALSLDMAQHWAPVPEGFFSRLTKLQLMSLLAEAGHDDEARRVIDTKKADGAALAARTLGAGWLPVPLRPVA